MTKKALTVQDVARVAGVSTATVSRALTDPDKVSKTTRSAVFDAVKKTGYRVNRAARNLRTQKSNAILVILPDLANPFFSEILEGIASRLSSAGYSVLVAGTKQISAAGEQLIDYFDDGRADGMIILDGDQSPDVLETLAKAKQSDQIVFACEWIDRTDFPSVRSDNLFGAQAAVQHLFDLGHRKIGHISGPEGNVLTQSRRDSAIVEMTRLGIPPRAEWIISGGFKLEDGQRAAKEFLQMEDQPTALFCASDLLAMSLISELGRHGVKVPEDLSVIGFDDIELAEYFIPSLTTIRQDRFTIGRDAAEVLIKRIRGSEDASQSLIQMVPVGLVERESTAPSAVT